MTLWKIYNKGKEILKNTGIDSFQTDAMFIFEHIFAMNRQQLILSKDDEADDKSYEKFFNAVQKRVQKIPLQYILGQWEFMGLEFRVGEGVLIPREETELLVRESAKVLSNFQNPRIVDLCSGTGCIAITLAKILKNNPKITAIELSETAFEYLTQNIKMNDADIEAINNNIFECFDLFENNSLDAIISNPPYVKSSDISSLQMEVKHEPKTALDGGVDGLDFYKKICKKWMIKLKVGGLLAFEIGLNQNEEVEKLMKNNGIISIKIKKDINGIDRVIWGIRNI